ncbi:hypothetical protein [Aliiglaciecola litoralis]|uniref:CpsD/CapB family tyrosine-protein kinase n=1 Tax=Aliiglaciecola litoralis TaxID=582857 RepID=A0ABN1LJ72_9ALTE
MARKSLSVDDLANNTAYQHLRLKLLSENIIGKNHQAKVIGLLSRTSGEGVTTTAIGLALATHLRAPGSTLLIDANPSEFRVADVLKCESKHVASIDFRAPEPNIEDYVVSTNSPGLPLLTIAPVGNAFTCSSAEFAVCWPSLKQSYETIIVDIGAWSTEAPLGWIEQLDDLILVLDGNHTTQEMLSHFKRTIDRCGCKLSGFIMNKHERPIPNFVYRMIT